jgi:hypothetical protein
MIDGSHSESCGSSVTSARSMTSTPAHSPAAPARPIGMAAVKAASGIAKMASAGINGKQLYEMIVAARG